MATENNPLVSVIIPVYKVEQYLDECVESVLGQSYSNLEIILIDDGSPDNCGAMCDKYASVDARVKVIHKQNEGVAKARNTGLEYATGDYIFFVDSDDFIAKNAIETLLMIALEHSADMVCSSNLSVNEDGRALKNTAEAFENIMCMATYEAMCYYAPKEWAPWNRLISAEIHDGIKFPDYKIHEDEAIKFRLLERCKKVAEISAVTYMYRQRSNSITSSTSTDRMDMFYSRYENLQFLKENYPNVCHFFIRSVCDGALLNLGILCSQPLSEKRAKRISEIISFAKEDLNLILRCGECSLTQKVRVLIALCSNWEKENCLYTRFYTMVDKVRGRR